MTRSTPAPIAARLARIAALGAALAIGVAATPQTPGRTMTTAPARPPAPFHPLVSFLPLVQARFFGDAEIVFANHGPEARRVALTWFAGANTGERFAGSPIDIPGLETVTRPLRDLMPAGVTMTTVVGLWLEYDGRAVNHVAAQVTLLPTPGSEPVQSLDVPPVVPADLRSTRLNGVWATPRGDERNVIGLVNTTDHPLTVNLTGSDGKTSEYLAPHAGRLFNRAPRTKANGADFLALEFVGEPGDLLPTGFAFSPTDRTPRRIQFSDPAKAVGAALFAIDLPLTQTSVALALANTSEAPLVVTGTLIDPDTGASQATIPPLRIAAHHATAVDLRQILPSVQWLRRSALRIDSDGRAGAVIGDLHAIDLAGGLTHETPLRDVGDSSGSIRGTTGRAPWRLDDDYNSRFVIANSGAETATLHVQIVYVDGCDHPAPAPFTGREEDRPFLEASAPPGAACDRRMLGTAPIAIAKGATMAFDLREMRDVSHQLPAGAEHGEIQWSVLAGAARVAARTEVTSARRHVSSSFTW